MKKYISHIIFMAIAFGSMVHTHTMNQGLNDNLEQEPRSAYAAFDDEFRAEFVPAPKRVHLKDVRYANAISWKGPLYCALGIFTGVKALQMYPTVFGAIAYAGIVALPLLSISLTEPQIINDLVAALAVSTCKAVQSTYKNSLNDKHNLRRYIAPQQARLALDVAINQKDANGNTLLIHCCKNDWDALEKEHGLLAKAGLSDADEEDKGKFCTSLLHELIAHGADIHARDMSGDILTARYAENNGRAQAALYAAGVSGVGFARAVELFIHCLDDSEKRVYFDMLQERLKHVPEPTLEEAALQYQRIGFADTLKKWCENDKLINTEINNNSTSVQVLTDLIHEYAADTLMKKDFLNAALAVATQKHDNELATMLRERGAQDPQPAELV